MINDFFKLYQLAEVFIVRYGFEQRLIRKYGNFMAVELWLHKRNDPNYQLIRLTTNKAEDIDKDLARIHEYINQYNSDPGDPISFLDIHISKAVYDEKLEPFPFLNIDEDYAQGVDVSEYYPDIYNVIHNSDKPAEELSETAARINEVVAKRHGKTLNKKVFPYVTVVFMAISIIFSLLSVLLQQKYSESSVLVFLGCDYMTFTLGLKQLYRLFTTAFIHGGFLHLFTNMYSLFYLGNLMEKLYGHKFYFCLLVFSILCGSLTQSILSENTISVGISGGIYGLLIFLVLDLLSKGLINIRSLIPLFIVNLFINFLSITAWKAHVGGFVAGYVMHFFYNQPKEKKERFLLPILLILGLFIRYITIRNISPLYRATDLEVVRIFKDLGFDSYGENIMRRLLEVYNTYGG